MSSRKKKPSSTRTSGKRGQPCKLTPAITKHIAHAVKLGAPYQLAARAGGIVYETMRDWMRRGEGAEEAGHPDKYTVFSAAIRSADVAALNAWMQHIEKAASDGNWQAAAWKAERRYPEHFSRPAPQGQSINFNLIIGQVVQHIARLIPDPDVRLKLADDLEQQPVEAETR